MVISVITNGIGNQLYDFFLGYLFSERYKQELKLAVCSDYGRFDRYNILRELCIPQVDIIRYDNRFLPHKCGQMSKALEQGIKDYLKTDSVKVLGTEDFVFDSDWHLKDESALQQWEVLVLNPQSYSQMGFLWTNREELAPFFQLKKESEKLARFKLQLPKNAVAVHVRASMQIREIGEESAKQYFRTAIEWYRRNFSETGFFIFSNEMELAKKWIGQGEDIFYMEPHQRGVLGDLEELMRMAMLPHKILSHGSTYSEMALVFGPQSGNTYIQGISPRSSYYKAECKALLGREKSPRRYLTSEHINKLGGEYSFVPCEAFEEKDQIHNAEKNEEKKHFVIFLSHHSFTDSLDVLEQLGIVLRRKGYPVSFVFKASELMEDEFEALSWRYRGEDFGGCRFYYYDRITATGSLEVFLADILLKNDRENIILYKGAEPMIRELLARELPDICKPVKKICFDDYDWQCAHSDGVLSAMDEKMQQSFCKWSNEIWNGNDPASPIKKRPMFTAVSREWGLEEQEQIPEDILYLAEVLAK